MDRSVHAEALMQTPNQKESGTATYRIFLDGAWRNVEGEASWKNLPQRELIAKIQEAYFRLKGGMG